jgi:hypothetical protein
MRASNIDHSKTWHLTLLVTLDQQCTAYHASVKFHLNHLAEPDEVPKQFTFSHCDFILTL